MHIVSTVKQRFRGGWKWPMSIPEWLKYLLWAKCLLVGSTQSLSLSMHMVKRWPFLQTSPTKILYQAVKTYTTLSLCPAETTKQYCQSNLLLTLQILRSKQSMLAFQAVLLNQTYLFFKKENLLMIARESESGSKTTSHQPHTCWTIRRQTPSSGGHLLLQQGWLETWARVPKSSCTKMAQCST